MTKMVFYIQRYGSAINFYGGTGESSHKFFVKAPGLKTQRHVSKFVNQVANQYYHILVTTKALRSIDSYEQSIQPRGHHGMQTSTNQSVNCDNPHNDDIEFDLCGKYSIQVTESLTQKAIRGEDIYPQWKTNMNGVKNSNYKFHLHPRLVNAIINRVNNIVDVEAVSFVIYDVEGYTRLTTISHSHDGNQVVSFGRGAAKSTTQGGILDPLPISKPPLSNSMNW